MLDEYDKAFERIEAWWSCEAVDRACITFSMRDPDREPAAPPAAETASDFWPRTDCEPDLAGLARHFREETLSRLHFGESIPKIPHHYGERGTPMINAAYLGGAVKLAEDTVWVDPVIEDWDSFEVRFDPENVWWRRSCRLVELSCEAAGDECIPWLPDYGDCLTVFSLLRGSEKLLFDIIDSKEKIIAARDAYLDAWPKWHRENWEVYRRTVPGDCSWLVWAPGKTYACQCDFSTILSPGLFEEIVVPELEAMGRYLDYIIFHLDGPDEIKYLDMLLDMPEIKAIQWVPGAGNPTAVHSIPMLRRIQEKKRALWVSAADESEVTGLLEALSPEGLFINGGFTGGTRGEADELVRTVEKLSAGRK